MGLEGAERGPLHRAYLAGIQEPGRPRFEAYASEELFDRGVGCC